MMVVVIFPLCEFFFGQNFKWCSIELIIVLSLVAEKRENSRSGGDPVHPCATATANLHRINQRVVRQQNLKSE